MTLSDYDPPLVAILRGLPLQDATTIAATLFDAGFRIVEVPLNRLQALEAIAAIARNAPSGTLVGGGTMLTRADVDAVAAAGGRLFVAPHCDPDVIRHAREAGMFCLPGVATPTEAFAALAAGAHGLKLFPAEALGLSGLRALRTVLPPDVPVFPVGGIEPASMSDWVRAGARGFGIGSALYRPGMTAQDLAPIAIRFVRAWQATHDA